MTVISLDPPRKSRMDKFIDAMFQALPAESHKQIRQRVGRTLGRTIRPWEVGAALFYLRQHSDEYDWTVPHAQRGRSKGGPRFFHVLIEKGRDPYFDDEHKDELDKGLISTLHNTHTSMEHERAALLAAAPYCKDHFSRRLVASVTRRFGSLLEDVNDVIEMLEDTA